jgi:hypothetical protein
VSVSGITYHRYGTRTVLLSCTGYSTTQYYKYYSSSNTVSVIQYTVRVYILIFIFSYSQPAALSKSTVPGTVYVVWSVEFRSFPHTYLIYRILKSYDLKEKDVQVNISIITVTVSKIDGKLRVQQLCRGCVCREFSSYRILKSYDLNGSKS